jgi:hypothetical protein
VTRCWFFSASRRERERALLISLGAHRPTHTHKLVSDTGPWSKKRETGAAFIKYANSAADQIAFPIYQRRPSPLILHHSPHVCCVLQPWPFLILIQKYILSGGKHNTFYEKWPNADKKIAMSRSSNINTVSKNQNSRICLVIL